MPKSSSQGDILHIGAVRLRITGSGNLKQSIHSLDDIKIVNMTPYAMSATSNKEKTTLVNYMSQRGQFEGKVVLINEYFNISKIVIFTKVVFGSLPQ